MRPYTEWLLPWMMEKVLTRPVYREQRRAVLRGAEGRVLEIGFGFGGTIAEYPGAQVQEVVALEPNPGMLRRARRRLAVAPPFPVRLSRGVAEAIPFLPGSFDTVVSNWTLCTIERPPDALREIHRVLTGSGRFLFLEHGLSAEPGLAR